jgi:putative SOS response-associated peptidase YedK
VTDGFYEWQRDGKTKQPYRFEVNERALFAFAGLWDQWKGPTGEAVEIRSILTTTANALTASVHDRVPVILRPDDYDLWLDPRMKECQRCFRTVEALGRSGDAVLSNKR